VPKKKAENTKQNFNFSQKLKELDEITSYLDSNEVELTVAMNKFEQGTAIAQELKLYLESAENKVETLKQNFEKK
jgi:exodeoxyribonuclease VII small subunit